MTTAYVAYDDFELVSRVSRFPAVHRGRFPPLPGAPLYRIRAHFYVESDKYGCVIYTDNPFSVERALRIMGSAHRVDVEYSMVEVDYTTVSQPA